MPIYFTTFHHYLHSWGYLDLFIFMVESLYNGMLLCISFQLHVQWGHICSLKLAMVGVLKLQKLAKAIEQGLPQWLLNIYQNTAEAERPEHMWEMTATWMRVLVKKVVSVEGFHMALEVS